MRAVSCLSSSPPRESILAPVWPTPIGHTSGSVGLVLERIRSALSHTSDLPGVTACLVASGLMEVSWLGRKWPMVVSAALMGLALALYQIINSRAASIGFNAMEYWFQRCVLQSPDGADSLVSLGPFYMRTRRKRSRLPFEARHLACCLRLVALHPSSRLLPREASTTEVPVQVYFGWLQAQHGLACWPSLLCLTTQARNRRIRMRTDM